MYIYVLNYPGKEEDFCHLEMKRIFTQAITRKHIITDMDVSVSKSVFFKYKLTVLEKAETFEVLLSQLKKKNYYFTDFKMMYVKHEDNEVEYQDSLSKIRLLCDQIDGTVDMHHPKLVLGLSYIGGYWYFCIVDQDHQAGLKYQQKPNSYSMSLSARDARVCVNIAYGNQEKTLVDPCCGVGTVLLEAMDQNMKIDGYEINPIIAAQANENLMHYGFKPKVTCQDMHVIQNHYDVALLDIPYGLYSQITPQQQNALIQTCFKIADELVLISFEDMDAVLEAIGYQIIERCTVSKGHFKRYIRVCKSDFLPCLKHSF